MSTRKIIHLSDWNMTNKAYFVSREVIESLKEKVKLGEKIDLSKDFLGQEGVELTVGIEHADYFLDWDNVIESIKEWE